MSFDRQVNPSPIALIGMPSLTAARFSPNNAPVCFRNWNISTRMLRPQARNRTPRAAVVLPLPFPVLMTTRPFLILGPLMDRGSFVASVVSVMIFSEIFRSQFCAD